MVTLMTLSACSNPGGLAVWSLYCGSHPVCVFCPGGDKEIGCLENSLQDNCSFHILGCYKIIEEATLSARCVPGVNLWNKPCLRGMSRG